MNPFPPFPAGTLDPEEGPDFNAWPIASNDGVAPTPAIGGDSRQGVKSTLNGRSFRGAISGNRDRKQTIRVRIPRFDDHAVTIGAQKLRGSLYSDGKDLDVPVQPVEHKLAAIFAADIAGYSRLMANDEIGVRPAESLRHHHRRADRNASRPDLQHRRRQR
jgi:hypothetical protein